jgi:hypothetical protein
LQFALKNAALKNGWQLYTAVEAPEGYVPLQVNVFPAKHTARDTAGHQHTTICLHLETNGKDLVESK